MRKIVFSLLVITITMSSCGKKESSNLETTTENTTVIATEPIESKSSSPGLELIEASDCVSCHKTDQKLIGPSYQEIADKYSEGDLELLANKIIDGGSGVWGQVPMQAHPNVNREDAKKMVEYILSLKK